MREPSATLNSTGHSYGRDISGTRTLRAAATRHQTSVYLPEPRVVTSFIRFVL